MQNTRINSRSLRGLEVSAPAESDTGLTDLLLAFNSGPAGDAPDLRRLWLWLRLTLQNQVSIECTT
jgi:hypothetical protein